MRASDSVATRRRNARLGIVCTLSKFTTQSLGTRSRSAVSSSSETRSRLVRVSAATVTDPIRSATGSRVNTSTGRSPPGVAANQISPRFIARGPDPIRPVLCWAPISDVVQRQLRLCDWKLIVVIPLAFAAESNQVAVERVPQELRTVHPKPIRPLLGFRRFVVRDPKAEHRHTINLSRITATRNRRTRDLRILRRNGPTSPDTLETLDGPSNSAPACRATQARGSLAHREVQRRPARPLPAAEHHRLPAHLDTSAYVSATAQPGGSGSNTRRRTHDAARSASSGRVAPLPAHWDDPAVPICDPDGAHKMRVSTATRIDAVFDPRIYAELGAAARALLLRRNQRIFTLRFGLTDAAPHTLADVAAEFGVSRERIRQLVGQSIVVLRKERGLYPTLPHILGPESDLWAKRAWIQASHRGRHSNRRAEAQLLLCLAGTSSRTARRSIDRYLAVTREAARTAATDCHDQTRADRRLQARSEARVERVLMGVMWPSTTVAQDLAAFSMQRHVSDYSLGKAGRFHSDKEALFAGGLPPVLGCYRYPAADMLDHLDERTSSASRLEGGTSRAQRRPRSTPGGLCPRSREYAHGRVGDGSSQVAPAERDDRARRTRADPRAR
jgi:hypothetical protein